MVDCTSHILTVTILINLEICELCSHHLFRKWWCDRWGMWFTFKSWFNEPWGQIEPHTNPSAVKWTHVHVKHLVRRERATASDSLSSSLHPSKLRTPSQQVESGGWNASGSCFLSVCTQMSRQSQSWDWWLAGHRAGSATAQVLRWMNFCCVHSEHVMTACAPLWSIPSKCPFFSPFRSWWQWADWNTPPSLAFQHWIPSELQHC